MTQEHNDLRLLKFEQANQVHQTLLNLLLAGGGLNEVAHELTTYIGLPVIIANVVGAPLAGRLSSAAQTQFDKFLRGLARSQRHVVKLLQAQARQMDLFLIPLIIQDEIKGYLATEMTGLDEQGIEVLEQGATVATLALIKHQAVREAEQRLRRNLLEDLLTGDPWTGERLAEQARSLGWEFDSKPVVILIDFGQARRYTLSEHGLDPSQRNWVQEQLLEIVRQILTNQNPQTILAERNNGFIILPHLHEATIQQTKAQATQLMETMIQQIKAAGLKVGFVIAGGGFHTGVDGLRRSFREAQQALQVGTHLMTRRPIWFDEVHHYLLLLNSGRHEDVRDWFERTLGELLEYDRRNKTDMMQTLETYFDTNQRLQEAAHALHIHPNTLKYRLRRIEQILGQDPFYGENQLRFYLATKMARLL